MNTDELLEKIGKLIETKLQAEREHTRKLVREEVGASEKRVKRHVSRKLNKALNTLIEYYDGHVIHLRGRIERLEEKVGTPNPHKN